MARTAKRAASQDLRGVKMPRLVCNAARDAIDELWEVMRILQSQVDQLETEISLLKGAYLGLKRSLKPGEDNDAKL